MNPIIQRLEEGTLIRKRWERTEDGKHFACLYVALAGEGKRPGNCPASLMPEWLAYLTPWIDDAGTTEHWPDVVRRYAGLSERWHVLSPEDWTRLDYRVRREALLTVLPFAGDSAEVVQKVIALLNRVILGEAVTDDEWQAATTATRTAWAAAATSTESATATAAEEAMGATAVPATAAGATAAAATWAMWVAGEEGEEEKLADTLTDKILDTIEDEIIKKENG